MITRKFDHRNEKYLTAIAIVPAEGDRPAAGKKYRKIRNQPAKLARFERVIRTLHPHATHINFYGRRSKKFCYRLTLIERPAFVATQQRKPLTYKYTSHPVGQQTKSTDGQPKLPWKVPDRYLQLPDLLSRFDQYVPW